MSRREEPYGAVVTERPPKRASLVAPERDVTTGRYGRGFDRSHKHHHPPRSEPAEARRRRLRPWHVAAVGAAVLAVAGGVLVAAASGSESPAATTAARPAATTIAAPSTTVAPTTSTAATTTLAPTTTLSAEQQAAAALHGTYHTVLTVTDGNPNFAIGTTREIDITLVTVCAASCTITSPEYGDTAFSLSGDTLSATVIQQEPCSVDKSKSVDDVITVELQITGRDPTGAITALTGTQTVSSPNATEVCGDGTLNDPVVYSQAMTRTG